MLINFHCSRKFTFRRERAGEFSSRAFCIFTKSLILLNRVVWVRIPFSVVCAVAIWQAVSLERFVLITSTAIDWALRTVIETLIQAVSVGSLTSGQFTDCLARRAEDKWKVRGYDHNHSSLRSLTGSSRRSPGSSVDIASSSVDTSRPCLEDFGTTDSAHKVDR